MHPSRAFLFSLEQFGIKLGLEQIRGLVRALDEPDRAFPSIVVAGTNGKGSVSAMLERGLRAAGLRTGRYTSPHLVRLEERFAVNGIDIDAGVLDAAIERLEAASRTLPAPPSFFEATTAIALDLFREARVDVAVMEVGLGGRLDATNVVTPVGVAITMIDFDHQQYLGNTIEEIAREKAGVIKPGSIVVLGANPPAVHSIVEAACEATGARLVPAEQDVAATSTMARGRIVLTLTTPRHRFEALTLGLRGRHQVGNAIVAIRLLEEMAAAGIVTLDAASIRAGVEDVVWPGRLELLSMGAQAVLVDGAHNPAGARALATYLSEVYAAPVPVVIGVMRDKDIPSLVDALRPVASRFICTRPDSPRACPPDELARIVAGAAPEVPVVAVADPIEALRVAAESGGTTVVAGSLYLAGEIRAHLS